MLLGKEFSNMDFCIILATSSNIEESKKIAHALVENKLAACVNIIPNIISVYSWQNNIAEDGEFLLVIKSRESLFNDIKQAILNLHSYELPEIIVLPIKEGHKDYLKWIEDETTEKR